MFGLTISFKKLCCKNCVAAVGTYLEILHVHVFFRPIPKNRYFFPT